MIYSKQCPYIFKRFPTPLLKSNKFDNITIVPASLLPFKKILQAMANTLPRGSILICHSPTNIVQQRLLEHIFLRLQREGKNVVNISAERII